ncbi:MAG: hypothetical protein C4289_06410, partial [Chloroflexota bacterium]
MAREDPLEQHAKYTRRGEGQAMVQDPSSGFDFVTGPVRVGIIGAGSMARTHAAALMAIDAVRLTAVADPELERAKELAAACGARASAELADVLEEVDAVWLCTPPFLHAAQAVAAAA